MAMPAALTPEEIRAALHDVLDPEFPISVVDLGLIRGVAITDRTVKVKLTYTCMGCPAMEMIQDDVRDHLLQMDGVERVEIEVVWDQWSRRDITARGMARLKEVGVV
jgi:metal-sulfur cluster biosynthetic enzyme